MTQPFEDSKLHRRLRRVRHGAILVIGTGQWGKTVAINSLVQEDVLADRNVVLINYDDDFVKEIYPDRYRGERWPEDLRDLTKILRAGKDFIIIDDAIFLAGSRDSQTRENKDLQKVMTILSHNDLFAAVTIQNTSLLDIGMMQSQDVHILHKHMDPLSMEFERPMMRIRQATANLMLGHYRRKFTDVHPKAFSWCSSTSEMIVTTIPHWWEKSMSKAFRGKVPT